MPPGCECVGEFMVAIIGEYGLWLTIPALAAG